MWLIRPGNLPPTHPPELNLLYGEEWESVLRVGLELKMSCIYPTEKSMKLKWMVSVECR